MQKAEKRTRPRITVDAMATLQVLGASWDANRTPIPIRGSDARERVMCVQSHMSADAGLAGRLDVGEDMFVGEVSYCSPAVAEGAALYNIGIVTEQRLTRLSGLRRLISAFEPNESHKPGRV